MPSPFGTLSVPSEIARVTPVAGSIRNRRPAFDWVEFALEAMVTFYDPRLWEQAARSVRESTPEVPR